MSFIKPERKQESEQDALQKLMCYAPGCRKRWSVHIDGNKPMCSEHQWIKPNPAKAKEFNAWAEQYV
jgi:hypothetical protein